MLVRAGLPDVGQMLLRVGAEASEVGLCLLETDLVRPERTDVGIRLADVIVLPEAHLANLVLRRAVARDEREIAATGARRPLDTALAHARPRRLELSHGVKGRSCECLLA